MEDRIQGGPYWSQDGALLFLNDRRGKQNVVYEIPAKELMQETEPTMRQHEFIAPRGMEYSIRGVWDRVVEGQRHITFASQRGEQFWPLLDSVACAAKHFHRYRIENWIEDWSEGDLPPINRSKCYLG